MLEACDHPAAAGPRASARPATGFAAPRWGPPRGCGRGRARLNSGVPLRPKTDIAPLALGAALLLSSCSRDEVTHFRVAKAPQGGGAVSAAAHQGSAPPPGMAGDVPAPPAPAQGLRWTLPRGWTDERKGGMRFATLKAPVSGRLDGSVVVLSGQAGGELMNVNRWRGQIALDPIDGAALAAARQEVRSKAGTVWVYDFASEGPQRSRVIAGILPAGESTWFVKVTGDADAVGAARKDFLALLGSLRLE